VRNYTYRYVARRGELERGERSPTEDSKRFFKLFEESPFDKSQAVAQKMKKNVDQTQHILNLLLQIKDAFVAKQNSPLLVMLHFIDPNVLFGE
jgi:hypothetical protein